MQLRKPIDTLIADQNTPHKQRQLFDIILQARRFASEQLFLPENNSYTSYVALDKDYVVWNVFATPELSLEPVKSCFLIVGCLEYRGYFAMEAARDHALKLQADGFDVFLGGVAAYSTLGWFDDPVFSSMLQHGKWRTVETIFHELAHQQLYIKNDSAFNEAFATAVADLGLTEFLATQGLEQENEHIVKDKQWEKAFINLILNAQTDLLGLYEKTLPDQVKRTRKHVRLKKLKEEYASIKKQHQPRENYDEWMRDINNAKIASVVTYFDLTASFKQLFALSDQNYPRFYARVAELGALPVDQRHRCLKSRDPILCYEQYKR